MRLHQRARICGICSDLVVYPEQKNAYHISFTLKRRVYKVSISEPKPQILMGSYPHVLPTPRDMISYSM